MNQSTAVVVVVVIVVGCILLWWWYRRSKQEPGAAVQVETAPPFPAVQAPATVEETAPPEPDNLKRIEGIGPRISDVLQAAGIMTFEQLAATEVSRLRQILAEAGLDKLADPTTWPEQANLAASGEWDALETLQDELQGGRRVTRS